MSSISSVPVPPRQLTVVLQAITVDTRQPEAVARLEGLKDKLLATHTVKKSTVRVNVHIDKETVFGRGLDYFHDNTTLLAITDAQLYTGQTHPPPPGHLRVYVVLDGVKDGMEDRVVVGQYRHWWMGKRVTAKNLANVFTHTVLKQQSDTERDDDYTKTVPLAPRYHLCFSLVNEDPSLTRTQWDFAQHARPVLDPVVATLRAVADITVTSQVINYAKSSERPVWNERSRSFELSEGKLTRFVKANEWNLVATSTSSDPTLHFVTYVPSAQVTPVSVVDARGSPIPHNSFMSARWGGVRVQNIRLPMRIREDPDIELPVGQVYTIGQYEVESAIGVFVMQLRELLGVPMQFFDVDVNAMDGTSYKLLTPHGGLCLWELDVLLHRRVSESLRRTGNNLGSLARLINQLGNMVVKDTIGDEVTTALSAYHNAHAALDQDQLVRAHESAQFAWTKSEAAFFDPTMLSLLYFPDEHKLAMYVPLFAPIAVPILRYIGVYFKSVKARRAAAKVA